MCIHNNISFYSYITIVNCKTSFNIVKKKSRKEIIRIGSYWNVKESIAATAITSRGNARGAFLCLVTRSSQKLPSRTYILWRTRSTGGVIGAGRTRGWEARGLLTEGWGDSGFGAICRYLGCAWLRCYLSNYTATCDDTRPDCLKRGGSWTFAFVAVLPGDGEERGERFCRAIARTTADTTPKVNRISLYECRRDGDKTCRLLLVIGDNATCKVYESTQDKL